MCEYLDRLAAEDDCGDAVAAVRDHDDKVTTLRLRGIYDCSIGMFMLNVNHFARNACCLRCGGDGAKSRLRLLLHACLVLSPRILKHLGVGREHMKRQQDLSTVTRASIRWAKVMP